VKQQLVERTRELVQLRAAPEKELLVAEAELREAELAARTARARLETLRAAAEGESLFWVTAPRHGTVVDLDVVANQQVSPDRDRSLCRISDLDEVLVLADVQEADLSEVAPGATVSIRTQTQADKEGVVQHVASVVDPVRRAVEVRVRVENKDRKLRPNAFVEVSLARGKQQPQIRVPSEAVVTSQGRRFIFTVRGPGQLEQTVVITGNQRDGQVEIRSGLVAGTQYVARGSLLLLNELEFSR
jgi:cobalt-zinc-cadmium efflux system membrane fusion protein